MESRIIVFISALILGLSLGFVMGTFSEMIHFTKHISSKYKCVKR